MSHIDLFTITFGRPDLLREQKRLLDKHLEDEFTLTVVDNTLSPIKAIEIWQVAAELDLEYVRVVSEKHEHPSALNKAAAIAEQRESEYFGMLDHDVFARSPTTLIDKINVAGFYGIGQTHRPTHAHYLFPGFAFFKRSWVAGRTLNFDGIRGVDKRDDGDCGSMLHTLFSENDWARLHRGEHGYGHIRPEDDVGLQSWGYEFWDGFVHLTNASHWMAVPDPKGRDAALLEMLAAL